MEKGLLATGAVLSAVYLGFWALVLHGDRWTSAAAPLPLNEICDFMVGVCGPLVCLWLALSMLTPPSARINR